MLLAFSFHPVFVVVAIGLSVELICYGGGLRT